MAGVAGPRRPTGHAQREAAACLHACTRCVAGSMLLLARRERERGLAIHAQWERRMPRPAEQHKPVCRGSTCADGVDRTCTAAAASGASMMPMPASALCTASSCRLITSTSRSLSAIVAKRTPLGSFAVGSRGSTLLPHLAPSASASAPPGAGAAEVWPSASRPASELVAASAMPRNCFICCTSSCRSVTTAAAWNGKGTGC